MPPSTLPPRQKMRAINKRRQRHRKRHRHVPAELVSEILLNLPTKSLLRFSSVSKSWNSIISDPAFVRRQVALPGRERIAIVNSDGNGGVEASTFLIPSVSSNNPKVIAANLVCPFSDRRYHVMALCRELWLVRVRESLYLWNPSMRTYKRVSKPSSFKRSWECEFVLGLGYDSVGDDYKILKIPCEDEDEDEDEGFELYSLRSGSWRSIQDTPKNLKIWYGERECVLVSGNLLWIAKFGFLDSDGDSTSIKSFDLSTEKLREVGLPIDFQSYLLAEMSVLKGMLCLTANHIDIDDLDIWVMEEYGNVRSWTKKFSIECRRLSFSYGLGLGFEVSLPLRYQPLYLYENGGILIRASTRDCRKSGRMFVYKGEKTTSQEKDTIVCCHTNGDVFWYVDSLVAPSMWSR